MDPKRSTKKKEEAEAQISRRTAARARARGEKYAGPVAGCVFTTVRGVTGYYSDGPRRAAPRRRRPKTPERVEAAPEPEPAARPRTSRRPPPEEDDEARTTTTKKKRRSSRASPPGPRLGLHTALVDATTLWVGANRREFKGRPFPWRWQVET